MPGFSDEEYHRICDVADRVSSGAWEALHGQDMAAAMIVVGTLLANVERNLAGEGWDRERIIDEVCEIADACEREQIGGHA